MSMHTTYPWMDERLMAGERADLLLRDLSLDEKMAQVSCYFPTDIANTADFAERFPYGIGEVSCLEARSALTLDEVTRFQRRVQSEAMERSGHGIPAIFHMEGLCGAYLPGATSFPSGLGGGASWDVNLERRVGEIVGRQERALGVTHTLAPVLDVSRDPRMGRQGETYGEDPTLAAALGVAYTLGLQGQDEAGRRTEAVAKHFVGSHHTEGGIHGAHCNIPDRLLEEVYGKPFQAAITVGGLRGVMPSYNSVSGEPVSASTRLLTTLLREQMGFRGLVVSDYGAVGIVHTVQRVAQSRAHAGLAALQAGMDLELHVPQGFGSELRDWFAQGRADVALLDRAVRQVLTAKFRMGLFEHPFAPSAAERDRSFQSPADTAGFHVVAPDMLGYGQSAKIFDFENGQGFRMKHMARTLEALGIGSAHFAANSAGGHMLLKVMSGVIEADLDVASATLISPAPPALEGLEVLRGYDGTPDHMRRILEVLFLDAKWATDELVSERQASALSPGAFECTLAAKLEPPGGKPALVRDDVDYGVISVPTLVVVGEQDKLLFEGLPEQLARQAPLGRIEVMADAKHCAQIEQAARFNELFVNFLQTPGAGI